MMEKKRDEKRGKGRDNEIYNKFARGNLNVCELLA
jgi:hypothetical protein